jgi:hypothetical protein
MVARAPAPPPLPVTPTAEVWRAMTAEQRLEFQAERTLSAMREAVFGVLGARGIAVPAPVRHSVSACEDPAVLQRWLLRAATASAAEDVLAD